MTAADWMVTGCELVMQNRYQEAIAHFNKAIALDTAWAMAWNAKANALCALKRPAEALFAYDRAVLMQPNYHQAWFNRGMLLMELGAYGNAIESYNRAIAIAADPVYFHARETIGLKKNLVRLA